VWRPEEGTLLDCALAEGLRVPFGCRSGFCGRCALKVVEGATTYTYAHTACLSHPPVGGGEASSL
jgi:ferredoxin